MEIGIIQSIREEKMTFKKMNFYRDINGILQNMYTIVIHRQSAMQNSKLAGNSLTDVFLKKGKKKLCEYKTEAV